MLMTVLRGDLATRQSKALIRTFRAMKDYIAETQGLVTQRDLLRLSMQITENTEAIRSMHTMLEAQLRRQKNTQEKMGKDLTTMMIRRTLSQSVKESFAIFVCQGLV